MARGLTVVQFFTGPEVLALTVATGALGALGVAMCRPRVAMAARRQLLVAGAVGASLSGAVLAFPLWLYLAGPRHFDGPPWPIRASHPWNILMAGPDVFSTHTLLTMVGYLGPQGPNVDYLGPGLLLALGFSYPLWRRSQACRIVGGAALVCWILEFAPVRPWSRFPLLSSIVLTRFALPVSLCVALLLAASVDAWWGVVARRWPVGWHAGRRRVALAVLAGLVALACLPLVDTYSVPFRVTTATLPAWFEHVAPRLAPGTAVLTVPFAYGIASQPMAWQAETGDGFDLVGGWALVPGGNGVDDEVTSPLRGVVAALRALSAHPRSVTASQRATIRTALERWRPLAVVVVPGLARPGTVAVVTATVGFRPTLSDGSWVWSLRSRG